MKIDFKQFTSDCNDLGEIVKASGKKYTGVFGIPAGGVLPAFIVAQILKIPLLTEKAVLAIQVSEKDSNILIVDDLIDSGKTLEKYKGFESAVLYKKKYSPSTNYFVKETDSKWIFLPHEKSETGVEEHITRILEYIGEDPTREGLIETPKRVIKSYKEIFGGYKQKSEDFMKVFSGEKYDQMVVLKDIEFYSTCEHHMLNFNGVAHVAYLPNQKIIGLSKLARLVDMFSRRLQNQERLTIQVAEELQKVVNPLGVAVVFEGKHFCMRCRGVGKQNSEMITACMLGSFKDNPETRKEFYDIINR